jgi:hypothetical protein
VLGIDKMHQGQGGGGIHEWQDTNGRNSYSGDVIGCEWDYDTSIIIAEPPTLNSYL